MNLTYYTTTYENNKKKTVMQEIPFRHDPERENELINLYPEVTYQTLAGFGGAITDSAAYVYSMMDAEQKKEMVGRYFDRKAMKYRFVRIPIDSCDFSLEHYEADGEEDDEAFAHFSFDRVEKYILPLLNDAQKAYGDRLEIMLSPWSPPAYMKTNGERNNGGKLKPEYRKRWAEYICRYIEEYRNRGYLVTKLTMQNEPKATQTWDSCVYTAQEEKEFLTEALYPALVSHGLDDIDIYIWDHNKERAFEWAKEIIDETTDAMIKGIAFHWYSGDHFEALRMIHERFPQKELLLSEACIEYSVYGTEGSLANAQKYAHEMIGNLNEGMETFFDWNLILDEQGGPNHVGNFCDAPYLYDTEKKILTESNILGYLWHFCYFLESGSRRIGCSRYTDTLEVTAFQKGERTSVVILNRTAQERKAYLRMGEQTAEIVCPPSSISSGIIY